MNVKDWDAWKKFREVGSSTMTGDEVRFVAKLHAKYYKHKYFIPCNCRNSQRRLKIQQWIKDPN